MTVLNWLDERPSRCVRCGSAPPAYYAGVNGDFLLWCRDCNDDRGAADAP